MAKISIAVAIVAVAVLLSVLLSGCSNKVPLENKQIAAMVNGEKIYFDDVNEYYNVYFTPQQQVTMTKADALSLVIEREILYQEAAREKFTATDEEISKEYKSYLSSSNQTESRLGKDLQAKNSSISNFKRDIGKRIAIGKLMATIIPQKFIIKHEEVEAVYNASKLNASGVTFDQAQQEIINAITLQKQQAYEASYIDALKQKANVLITGVPD
jgi:hypothetical protein